MMFIPVEGSLQKFKNLKRCSLVVTVDVLY